MNKRRNAKRKALKLRREEKARINELLAVQGDFVSPPDRSFEHIEPSQELIAAVKKYEQKIPWYKRIWKK